MIRAILFDLDGTLVHYEYDDFLKAYLDGVAKKVAHLINPQRFVKKLLKATAGKSSHWTMPAPISRFFGITLPRGWKCP